MKRLFVLLALLQMGVLSQPGLAEDVERTEEVNKTLRFGSPTGDRLVVVDNVFGSIEVTGDTPMAPDAGDPRIPGCLHHARGAAVRR